MQVDIRRHVLGFLFAVCLNFQLLVLGLASLEAVHVVLVTTTVYNHWIENLVPILGLTNSWVLNVFYLTWNFGVSTDSVIIIDGGD